MEGQAWMVVTSTARRAAAALSARLTVDRDFPTEISVITLIMSTNRAARFLEAWG